MLMAALIGLAGAGGVYGIAQWIDSRPESPEPESSLAPDDPLLLWPFLAAEADQNQTTSFVFVAADPLAHNLSLPAGARWLSEDIGIVDVPTPGECHIEGAECPSVAVAPDGPRFGRDGYNATVIRFWAFDTQGRLFATNTPTIDTDVYELHPQFQPLPRGAWYLGTGDAPNGTQNLPMFKSQARALLDGLPQGGIATTITNQFEWYMGDSLVMTARIDGLRHAP